MMKRRTGFYGGCRPSSGSASAICGRDLPAVGALDAAPVSSLEASGAPPREGARRSHRLGAVGAAAEDAHVSLLRLG